MVGQTIALFDLGTLQTAETAPSKERVNGTPEFNPAPIMHGFSLFWITFQANVFTTLPQS